MSKDKTKMTYRDGVWEYQFGDYRAIEGRHHEDRRDERIKSGKHNIFGKKNLTYEQLMFECFQKLEHDKYDEIVAEAEKNKPKSTVFVVGFQLDEFRGKDPLFFFTVFSACKKVTAKNDIATGEDCIFIMTPVKDVRKIKVTPKPDEVECHLTYASLLGHFKWVEVGMFFSK